MKRIIALILLTLAARADVDIVLYSQTENTGGTGGTTTNIISGVVTNGSLVDANGYCRPSDWLPLPELVPTEQKVVFLYAIFPPAAGFDAYGGNHYGVRVLISSGNYLVDWGDGNVSTNASNTTATHGWDYANIPTNTLCSRGYKQVIVTVSAQTEGATFSGNFGGRDYRDNRYALASNGILDFNIEGGFTGIAIFGTASATVQPALYCERVKSASCVLASGQNMFLNAYSLQSVDINTRSMSSGQSMFSGCSSLKNITFNSTTNMSNVSSMFAPCVSLERVYGLSTLQATTVGSIFSGSQSLRIVSPSINTANSTTLSSTFNSCFMLTDVGTIDLSACTAALSGTFNNLYSLRSLHLINMRTNIVAVGLFNSGLSREALTNLFTDLPDRTGTGLSQAITVTGARGAAALTAADKAIATNKLWTVTN